MAGTLNKEDAYKLAVFALRQSVKKIDAYDEDPDADAGDTLEDIRAICEDVLLHLSDLAAETGQDEEGRTMREQYRDQESSD